MTAPYRTAALDYWQRGWRGVLPVPALSKALSVVGYTGHGGVDPSYADIHAWTEGPEGSGNIALRLPPGVIGLDVDDYGSKRGGLDLMALIDEHGRLPPTWRSSSRDGVSGIYLFRVPEQYQGRRYRGKIADSIDLIYDGYRYSVVWPSVHPEERLYRWYEPSGDPTDDPPAPTDLPFLPEAWCEALPLAGDVAAHGRLGAPLVVGWLLGLPAGPLCRRVAAALADYRAAVAGSDAHGPTTEVTLRLCRLGDEGHVGVGQALVEASQAFLAAVTNPARGGAVRSAEAAEAEWQRALSGAVSIVTASPSARLGDPCEDEWAGILAPGAPQRGHTSPAPPIGLHYDKSRVPPPSPAITHDGDSGGGAVPLALPGPTGATEGPLRTSWFPLDLAPALTGDNPIPPPAYLHLENGDGLLYAGMVNSIIGESESGKSWLCLFACLQVMQSRQHVLYIDFEDGMYGVVERLRHLGGADDDFSRFHYIRPEEDFGAQQRADLLEALNILNPALVVMDGVNAAMNLMGLDSMSNADATTFTQKVCRPITRTGACLVIIDHLSKHKEGRGPGAIGAQAKRASIDGASLLVDNIAPFGRGKSGHFRLLISKDRPGWLRGRHTEIAAEVHLSSGDDGSVTVRLEGPGTVEAEKATRQIGKQEGLRRQVHDLCTNHPEGVTGRAIRANVGGRATDVIDAIEQLCLSGHLAAEPGPRRAVLYRAVKPMTTFEGLVIP